jgi:hypothetical protein
MIEPNVVTTTLEAYADRADTAPADLLERVEQRYRRRRGRRVIGAGVAILVLVAAVVGGVALNPLSSNAKTYRSHQLNATVPTPVGWTVPTAVDPLPTIQETWPHAAFRLPAQAPGGGRLGALASLDATHVLTVGSATAEAAGGLYSYDLATGGFTTLVAHTATHQPAFMNRFAIAPNWLVWEIDDKNSMDVYKVPRTGGTPRLISHVDTDAGATSEWAATDQAVYWSGGTEPGVYRLSLAGGPPKPLAGFRDFGMTAGSAWAVRQQRGVTEELKNVVTGQDLPVKTPADAVALSCSPTFCVGAGASAEWIQNLGDTVRSPLPEGLGLGVVCNCASGPVVVATDHDAAGYVLWTPSDGRIGIGASPEAKDGSSSSNGGTDSLMLGWQMTAGGPVDEYVALGLVD